MSKTLDNKLKILLKKFWGYDSFRANQLEIARASANGKDVFAVLATGAGKSLCYQIPGLYLDGITLVISPLIALMKDQMQALKKRGIKADSIMSGQSFKQQDVILDNAIYGDTKFLFVSPERLKSKLFKERLKKLTLALVAVDEAHCVSEWGHDFRPEYRQIAALREDFSEVPFIALTATATPEVRKDILTNLRLKDPFTFYGSPLRSNIAYRVVRTQNKRQKMAQLIKHEASQTRIVYVTTRKLAMSLSQYLNHEGLLSAPYHGGMTTKERDKIIEKWTSGEIPIVVATKAFGMGIDKADVREVIHFELPESLEAFVQESGRAGRDGLPARSVLLYHNSEQSKIKKNIDELFPDLTFIKNVYSALGKQHKIGTGKVKEEMIPLDMESLCSSFGFSRKKCLSALKILQKKGFLKLNKGSFNPSKLVMDEFATKRLLRNDRYSDKMKSFIKLLLRSYEGIFLKYIIIDEKSLAQKFGVSQVKVIEALEWLVSYQLAKYIPNHQGTSFAFQGLNYKQSELQIEEQDILNDHAKYVKRINALFQFIHAQNCRQQLIAEYFGFANEANCGICDVCENSNAKPKDKDICAQIVHKISLKINNIEDLISSFDFKVRNEVMRNLSYLISERLIRIEGQNVYLIE